MQICLKKLTDASAVVKRHKEKLKKAGEPANFEISAVFIWLYSKGETANLKTKLPQSIEYLIPILASKSIEYPISAKKGIEYKINRL